MKHGREALIGLVLFAAVFAVFGQVVTFDFVDFDDPIYVTRNYTVRGGLTLPGILEVLKPSIGLWHPLTWLSHMLDCQLSGMNPVGHHLTSLLLHAANTLILFLALARMTGSPWRSAFVAALFALHPLHVEPAAWVSSRKDVLSAFFWFLGLLGYAHYAKAPRLSRYLLVAVLFLLGLASKAMVVTLPVTLLLVDYWPLERFRGAGLEPVASVSAKWWIVIEKLPLLAMSAGAGVMTVAAARLGGSLRTTDELPLAVRLANAPVHYVQYIAKTLWPAGLSASYPLESAAMPWWLVAGCVALLVLVSWLALRHARRFPYLAAGWLWFLVTLAPVSGVLQVGGHSIADRYTYVPLVGLFIVVAWGGTDLLARFRRGSTAAACVGGLLVLVLGAAAYAQARHWRNSTALFEHMLEVHLENSTAHANLGKVLLERGEADAAFRHLAEALRISPGQVDAHINLGLLFAAQGRQKEAIDAYSAALRADPDNAIAHNNLGVLCAEDGAIDEAMRLYERALALSPAYPDALVNLGNVLLSKGDVDGAIERYQQALKLDPGNVGALCSHGAALLFRGDGPGAVEPLEAALRLAPGDETVLVNLAAAYERVGRRPDALGLVEKALQIDPRSEEALALRRHLERRARNVEGTSAD